MTPTNDGAMVVLAAGYSSVSTAVEAYDAVWVVYQEQSADRTSYCDAAVIDAHPSNTEHRSRVIRETPRQQRARGAHVEGLATRLGRYLGEGLALTGGPAGGGGQDFLATADTTEAAEPLDSADLNKLGAVQEASPVVLIGIFPAAMIEDITSATMSADQRASTQVRANAGQLEAQIVRAEQKSIADLGR